MGWNDRINRPELVPEARYVYDITNPDYEQEDKDDLDESDNEPDDDEFEPDDDDEEVNPNQELIH